MTVGHIDLDLRTADRLLELFDPTLRAEAVVELTGGNNSAVFEVRTADGRALVMKIYSDVFHWKMQKEVFVYEKLRRHDTQALVPSILVADDTKTLLPRNVLVMIKLDGRHVYSILEELDERELVEINEQVGQVLRTLHDVAFDEFGYVGIDGIVDPHRTNLDYMTFQFDKKLREFAELGGDPSLGDRIRGHVGDRERLLAPCPRPSFCHNDCHYGNVLVLPEGGRWRVSGLLDFENVVAGDPVLDIAKVHCYSPRRSETTLAALADGHGDLRGDWREAVDLYVLYHWLELWDWLGSHGRTEPLEGLAERMRQLTDV